MTEEETAVGKSPSPEGSWAALGARGFVVVRGFLSETEVERLRDAHRRAHSADVAVYRATEPRGSDIADVVRKVQSLLPDICRATGTLTDTVIDQGVFFATEQMNLGWHSDQKSDYLFQGHRDHLTFWLPIQKPIARKSGLAVVPMDRLRERAPDLFRLVVDRGSVRYEGGLFFHEESGADFCIPCPVNLDEICEAPALSEGDLLVFRSDVLHRTEDAETVRVSLSLRALFGGHRLTARRLVGGSPRKHARMRGEPNAFYEALAAFLLARRSEITVREFLETRERLARKELVPRLAFATARLVLPSLLAAHEFRRSASSP